MLNTAKAFNKTHSITGCLVYHNNQFVQTLHGDKKVIFELLEKIKVDKRHAHVNLVWDGPSEKEVFSGWHMAFYAPNLETNKDSLVDFKKTLLLYPHFTNRILHR
ncbi:BLUF domain-containing protein [Maribacter sp. PR1]|uniref:BLUF domain-containing protein n=1 Tax=Maribacter cobaltidurans TaxID=1178778 RepID=A0ABU7ITT9_9FLAO|nr:MULTISPECIES: BLUF domain-containing protein [Maribacter]MDC6388996.1 BLUF domain-containing protein [Maribacter sp. PR1]MEE1976384.1 BLUF domain-containing protein [Maribacter cobaltidurans]